jgi:hypothetical protein
MYDRRTKTVYRTQDATQKALAESSITTAKRNGTKRIGMYGFLERKRKRLNTQIQHEMDRRHPDASGEHSKRSNDDEARP